MQRIMYEQSNPRDSDSQGASQSSINTWKLIITSTMTFVVAFAWNDVFRLIFERVGERGSLIATIIYAFAISFLILMVIRWTGLTELNGGQDSGNPTDVPEESMAGELPLLEL